jgi:hypothetical protein
MIWRLSRVLSKGVNMDYYKISLVMREVLRMNDDSQEFDYNVSAQIVEAGIMLSSFISDKKVKNSRMAHSFPWEDPSDLIKRVHDATEELLAEREEYRKKRIEELERLIKEA